MVRILSVDDSPSDQVLLKISMRGCDAEVICISSEDEAKQYLADHKPDLLVSDLYLNWARDDGWHFLRWVKEQYPSLPVVVLSSSSNPADARAALGMGAEQYVTKPISIREIKELGQHLAKLAAKVRRDVVKTSYESTGNQT